MDFMPPFGRWIAERRKALDMTQAVLAQRIGYSLGAIRRVEAGTLRPSHEIAERLMCVLEIPPAARAEFIAFARGVEAPRRITHVPAPATSLVGRQEEIAQITAMLLRADVRLLMVTGPPGVGKTRLVIEVARHLAEHGADAFADGVCFVPLASLTDPNQVGAAILQALGGPTGAGLPVGDVLAQRLGDKRFLLVLDNFEHLLPAAALIATLLAHAPGLKVLVTSRALLHISGEYVYEAPPLHTPDPEHLPSLMALLAYPAIQLLVQRAQQVKASFLLTEANAYAVAQLCQRLDGLPLAIELAAVRLRAFTPQSILLRLDHHLGATLHLLAAEMRDLPPRQQTLRAAIDWSYHLLSAEEQALFMHFGVFAGTCALEAAQAVCDLSFPLKIGPPGISPLNAANAAHASQVANLMSSLIDKSLIQQVEGTNGEPRYLMLETLREYALERLEASGEAALIRERHARYYAQLCRLDMNAPAWPVVCTSLLKGFVQERDNLYAALAWSRHSDEPVLHLLICTIIGWLVYVGGWYLGFRGDANAIETDLAWSLQRSAVCPPDVRSIALQVLVFLYMKRGAFNLSAPIASEAIAVSLAAGDLGIAASALHVSAGNAYRMGDLALAEQQYTQQMELGERIGGTGWVQNALTQLGSLALDRDDFDRAAGLLQRALDLACALNIKTDIVCGQALVLHLLGILANEQGDYARAYDLERQAYCFFHEEGEVYRRYDQCNYLGRAALALGHTDQAEQHLVEGLHLAREYGLSPYSAFSYLAASAEQRGEMARSMRLLGVVHGATISPTPFIIAGPYAVHVRAYLQAAITAAEARLSDPALAAAWVEGHRMSCDQAIEYALGDKMR